MNEHAPISDVTVCGRCSTSCDEADNFCRRCGLELREQRLPSLRESRAPALWRPTVRSVVVRGVTLIALGRIAEFAVRRLVQGMLRPAGRAERRPVEFGRPRLVKGSTVTEEEQFVSETLFLRRTRVRR